MEGFLTSFTLFLSYSWVVVDHLAFRCVRALLIFDVRSIWLGRQSPVPAHVGMETPRAGLIWARDQTGLLDRGFGGLIKLAAVTKLSLSYYPGFVWTFNWCSFQPSQIFHLKNNEVREPRLPWRFLKFSWFLLNLQWHVLFALIFTSLWSNDALFIFATTPNATSSS